MWVFVLSLALFQCLIELLSFLKEERLRQEVDSIQVKWSIKHSQKRVCIINMILRVNAGTALTVFKNWIPSLALKTHRIQLINLRKSLLRNSSSELNLSQIFFSFHIQILKLVASLYRKTLSWSDSVQFPWTKACQDSLFNTNSQSWLKLMCIELVMPSNHLILCCSLLLLPSIFPSIRVFFQWVSCSHKVSKVLEFSFSISPSNEYSGLISFRMDWLDLLAVQGTLKSLLQHHSSKASILQHSAFFTVQLSHPDMTTGKTIALTRGTFVSKEISMVFNMLSRLVITFLPRSKHLLISGLQSPSAVTLELKQIGSHCFHCFLIYLPWSDGTGCHDLSFFNVEF